MRSAGRFKVALAQMTPILGDVRANVERVAALAAEAAAGGARLVVFPELALTGYYIKDLVSDVARPVATPDFEPLVKESRSIGIVAGFIEEGADAALYNSAVFWLGGEPHAVHRKVYLPTYGVFDESRYVARGRELRAFDSPLGRAGMLICEDLWHPSTVYILAQDGAELLIVISASPTREVGGEMASRVGSIWDDILRVQAVIHGLHVVFVNRVGFEDGVSFWGGSRIIGPDGGLIAAAPLFDQGLTFGEIDPRQVLRERTRSHHVWDEDPHLTLRCLSAALARQSRVNPGGGAGDGAARKRTIKGGAKDGIPKEVTTAKGAAAKRTAAKKTAAKRAAAKRNAAGKQESGHAAQAQRRTTGRAPARAHRRPSNSR